MISKLLKKIFGSRNDRLLKQYSAVVRQINALESGLQKLSDDELRAKTDEFRKRLADGATPDQILPEAFAVCREGSKRALGMRHFDMQLVGGMTLHEGKIAEDIDMETLRTQGDTLMHRMAIACNWDPDRYLMFEQE